MKAFDIEFYGGTKESLIADIAEASDQSYSYIVTPNVNHVVRLEHDNDLKRAYAMASLRICDSKVLYPMLRWLGLNIKETIPGSTLTEDLIHLGNDLGWTVTVIGCEAEEIEALRSLFPALTFHHHNPPMGFIDNPDEVTACVDFVISHPAHLVVLSVGCPRQEILALKIYEAGQATGVGLCVGASLNFLSGKVPRAPHWMQRMGMEWIHRVCMEPKRLTKRYAVDAIKVIPIIYRQFRQRPPIYMGGVR
jgi:exopolysaccharide biosynthesis WecB/TagA/CpsF family protein